MNYFTSIINLHDMKIFLVLILLLIFIILVLEFFEMISNPYVFTLSFLVLTILMYFLVFKKKNKE